MSDGDTDILVLRSSGPNLPVSILHEEISTRLTNRDVRLARSPQEERKYARTARVITGYGLTKELTSIAENLRLFVHVGIGTDGLPLNHLESENIAVTTASGLMPQVAEQVIGYLLFFARDFGTAWERNQSGEWRRYQPTSLKGTTVTIIGLGSIGRQLVERLQGFDVNTIGVRFTPSKGGPTDRVIGYEEDALHDALFQTDYLVLACPLSDTTRRLISEAEFDTLPPRAILVNVARGEVVDTDALTAAIQDNTLAGAALDVTDPEPLPGGHPLWKFGNVLITPHTGGNAPEHWENVADLLQRNLEKVDETGVYEDLENQVL